jgi:GTPase SAR1 family protein
MANYRRKEVGEGQYDEYDTPSRPRPSQAVTPDSDSFDFPPSLDQLTDNLELGKGQQEIWEEIYKLGVSGVDKYIELPQIVVVGDQSSGKSSVLEAITGVPFPRNSGMCTKFPTQINLRKAPTTSFSVDLKPDLSHSEVDKARISRFKDMIRGEQDLGVIVKRAEQTIWPHGQSVNSASKDTLQLDFSGPKKDYLTLVDLPGIIHANASNIMSDDEIVAIKELAIEYMRNPRSIILCVISAANDLNLQMVPNLARQIDPSGSRTLGVITKPDRIDSPESEEMFIRLAKNEIIKFELGWHVLRNRSNDKGEKNSSAKDRDARERQFFKESRWNVLDEQNLGIDALKQKMSSLLLHRFAEVIPHVVAQIEGRLDSCKRELADLGEGYGDVVQMRSKMREWCDVSGDYVSNAAEGYYRDHYKTRFFDTESENRSSDARIRKLRARINAENFRFEEELRMMGHAVEIEGVHPPTSNRRRSRQDSTKYPVRMTKAEFSDKRVEPVVRESAGQELVGDSNPLLVYKMFQKQSQSWDVIAERHMTIIAGLCESFLREVLDFVWPATISEKVFAALVEERLERRTEDATHEVQRLCKDRTRYAKSYDPEYGNLWKRWERKFMEVSGGDPANPQLRPTTGSEQYLAKMLAFYDVTLKVFMSNIIVQVVERHLVDDLERIFDTARVHDMPDEAIEEIFKEDEAIRNRRAQLLAERASMEAGLKSARRLAAKKNLKVVSIPSPSFTSSVELQLTFEWQYDTTTIESDTLENTDELSPTAAINAANPPLPQRQRRPETPEPTRLSSVRSSNPFYPAAPPTQAPASPYINDTSPSRPAAPVVPPPVPPYVPQSGDGIRVRGDNDLPRDDRGGRRAGGSTGMPGGYTEEDARRYAAGRR